MSNLHKKISNFSSSIPLCEQQRIMRQQAAAAASSPNPLLTRAPAVTYLTPPSRESSVSSETIHCDEDYDPESFDPVPDLPPVKGKKGIQLRNVLITYWPVNPDKTNIYVGDVPNSEPTFVRALPGMLLKPAHKNVTFYVSSLEVSPTTTHLHGHLYMEFDIPKTIPQIKAIIGTEHAKIFSRKGTQKQAIDYVLKIGNYEGKSFTRLVDWYHDRSPLPKYQPKQNPLLSDKIVSELLPFRYGVPKAQGSRSDLDRYVEFAFDGVTRAEFLASERGSGLRYLKYFTDACNIIDRTDRNDAYRANKRILYDEYCKRCEDSGELPVRYHEFVPPEERIDFKWHEQTHNYVAEHAAAAFDEAEDNMRLEAEGNHNKLLLDANLDDENDEDPTKDTNSAKFRQKTRQVGPSGTDSD